MAITNKKILYVNYSMAVGGIESMVFNACLYFKDKGYTVEVLTFKDDGVYIKKLNENNINVHVLCKNEGFDKNLIISMSKFLKNSHYDVIHTNNYTAWLYTVLSRILSFKSCNIVHTEHWIEQVNTKRRLFIERCLSFFTKKVICVSDNIVDILNTRGKLKADKLVLIYNGINTDVFSYNSQERLQLRQHYNIPDNAKVMGAVGRLVDVKNHSTLINAFYTHLKNYPQDFLIIVGGGPNRDALQNLINKHKASENIILVGEKDNIHSYLSLFDIYIMPSLSEGFSIGLLEAMSIGLPVIVSNVGGNKEIVKDNLNGLLVEPEDTSSLTELIERLSGDSEMKVLLGKNARDTVISNYSSKEMYDRYEEYYFS